MPRQTVKKGHFKDMMIKQSLPYKPKQKKPIKVYKNKLVVERYKPNLSWSLSIREFDERLKYARDKRIFGH